MNRRNFLMSAAGVAALGAAVAPSTALGAGAQAPAAPPAGGQAPAGGRAGRAGGGGGRGRGGGNIPAEKLARISIMTLNFNSAGILKMPWTANPSPTQTVDILDLPQYQMDSYGVPNMEFQTDHLCQSPNRNLPDAEFFKQVRAKLDAAKVTASQINLEIGGMGNLTGEPRAAYMTRAKKWVDLAPILGCKRLMVIQDGLAEETKANCISVWKELQDYARPAGITISAETRGGGGGRRAAGAPAPPPPTRPAWMLLQEVIEAAGGYSNVDLGGAAAADQQALHDCIRGLYKTSAGSMHIKSSPNWDIGLAVKFTESLGYKGLYAIEVNPEPAIRMVFNTLVANL
jgi:hypothetical protein